MIRTRVTRREQRGLPPSEHTEAVRFMRCVRAHEAAYPSLRWLHAIPNGGWRNKTVAAKLKGEGVRPGVHDYFWPVKMPVTPAPGEVLEPGSSVEVYSGLYIELKSGGGRPTTEQREFAAFVRSQGFKAVFARGWEEAWRAVCDYSGIRFNVI